MMKLPIASKKKTLLIKVLFICWYSRGDKRGNEVTQLNVKLKRSLVIRRHGNTGFARYFRRCRFENTVVAGKLKNAKQSSNQFPTTQRIVEFRMTG